MAEHILASGVRIESGTLGLQDLRIDPTDDQIRRRAVDEAGATRDVVRASLEDAGFEIAALVGFRREDEPRRRSEADGYPRIHVDVAEGEGAVLLVETDTGILEWQWPNTDNDSPSRRAAAATLTFEIRPPQAAQPNGDGRRGLADWAAETIISPFRTYVLRFVVRRSLKLAVDWLEGDKVAGPVPLKGPSLAALGAAEGTFNLEEWVPRPISQSSAEPLRRVLLLVHGTFSSTLGSFGQLLSSAEGREFLADAYRDYDLVLGYDHSTLARTPTENAGEILATLSSLKLEKGCEVDAVAFSRGGLVYRILAEHLLPEAGLDIRLGRAVFVGCTNGGTYLANPANWATLADVYTNMAVAAVRGIGALIGGGGGVPVILSEIIKVMGRFVQLLSQVAIEERYIPGLSAMQPSGATVTSLNGRDGPVNRPAHYFTISSSFEPSRGESRGMTADLARYLADRLTDRLFEAANDLVVHTGSMTDFGSHRSWVGEEDAESFGDTGDVYHTVYFGHERVASSLRRWLAKDDLDEVLAGLKRRSTADSGEVPRVEPLDFESDIGKSVTHTHASIEHGQPPPEPSDAQEDVAERHLAAEMQQYPRLGSPASVFVTLSAANLAQPLHAAAGASQVEVSLSVPVDVEVVPLSNCRVVGEARYRIDPSRAPEATVRFLVEGASRRANRWTFSPGSAATRARDIIFAEPWPRRSSARCCRP